MNLVLHYHPLSSFCWKVLIALYEKNLPFEPRIVDFGDPESRAAFEALWPIAKMPVLVDGDAVVPETSIIIDYLDAHHPGPQMVPDAADAARQVRLDDRFFDLYVQVPMQKIVGDRLRPAETRDAFGVAEARTLLDKALTLLEGVIGEEWCTGAAFTLADCAALPALFYANAVQPFAATRPRAFAYLERLKARPSVARVLAEAEPWFQYFPRGEQAESPLSRG